MSQHSAKDLYDLGWKKGNRIFIDGKLVASRPLKNMNGMFLYDREEDHTAVQRNIYFTTVGIQQQLALG